MKRFTEEDVQKMLSKTESQTPNFDKNVIFPQRIITPVRRRRVISLISAACLIIIAVAVLPFAILKIGKASEQPEYSYEDSQNSNSSQIIGTSSTFSEDVNTSIVFPESSDESRDVMNDSSDLENSDSSDELSKFEFEYPLQEEFFINEKVTSIEGVQAYFKDNPINHLGAYIRLPIFMKNEISVEDQKAFIKNAGNDLSIEFNDFINNNSSLFSNSETGKVSFGISRYGDWEIEWFDDYTIVVDDYNDYEFVEAAIEKFIVCNKTLIPGDDYEISVVESEDNLIVYLFDNERVESILTKVYSHKFVFEKTSESCFLKSVSSMFNDMSSLGKFETIFYEDALEYLCDPAYPNKSGYVLQQYEEYEILGYDVRYIASDDFANVCPFYVFVLSVGQENEIKSCFIPAVEIE